MAPCFFNHVSILQIMSFVLLLFTVTGSSLSHPDECLALYRFKQSIISHQDEASFGAPFDSWKIKSNASYNNGGSQSDCCLWDGVACSTEEEKSHVIGLDLSESFLHGSIDSNSTLFSLVHLQTLNLASNDFAESQIPSEIRHLKQLKALNLSRSGFSGQIPYEVGGLIQLSSLDLSWNPLKLQSPSFKKLVQNLTRLEELLLSEVDIGSSVPLFLANFSSLRSVILRYCGLRNEFPTSIFHLPKMKILDVSSNINLTGSFPEFRNNSLVEYLNLALTSFSGIVPKSISKLNHLAYLNLNGCFFSGNIPSSLSNLTQLTALGIANNEFTGKLPSLVSLSELSILVLSGNKFEDRRLPDWLGKLIKLNELYLNEMNLYGEILPFLGNLTNIRVVKMKGNHLTGHIPSSIFNLTELRMLNLGDNQLEGPILSSFSKLKSLQDLDLYLNNFSGKVELDIFLGLRNLENLLLSGNSISVVTNNNYTNGNLPQFETLDLSYCNLKEFPSFLRFQHNMIGLFLVGNEIDGLVPVGSWNNSQETLQVIDLSYNFITGFQQHPSFLPWVRLEAFKMAHNQLREPLPIPQHNTIIYDVSNNNLTGEIPPQICEMKSLQLLDVSSNNMTGILPPCLGSLSNSLLVLNLKQNNFHGTMMNAFTNGSLLKRIDLSENRFVGQVSKTLTSCTDLEVLSLGDNSFDGVFPSWLGTLAKLQVLNLRSNKFQGAIQVETNVSLQFPSIRIIDLSNNGFTGRLPHEYFQAWSAMKSDYVGKSSVMKSDLQIGTFYTEYPYTITLTNKGVKTEYEKILNIFTAIDLSCNNFEGPIPQSLQDLQGLESLNLSNNHLTGQILPSLGNLTNLESLDLSRNELSGKIPQELLQLGFLAFLNVSFNHLDGRIPQGKQFNTFQNNSYQGNPRLCGMPLSEECQNSKASVSPRESNKSESFLPSEKVDWIVILSGVASGLVIGILIGNFMYARYDDWLTEKLGMRKDIWIRPLRNKRRNQV